MNLWNKYDTDEKIFLKKTIWKFELLFGFELFNNLMDNLFFMHDTISSKKKSKNPSDGSYMHIYHCTNIARLAFRRGGTNCYDDERMRLLNKLWDKRFSLQFKSPEHASQFVRFSRCCTEQNSTLNALRIICIDINKCLFIGFCTQIFDDTPSKDIVFRSPRTIWMRLPLLPRYIFRYFPPLFR